MNRILVVDDDLDLCELLAKYLRREGFEIDIAHGGEAGAEGALSGDYALIVLDVMLPGLNGFEVLSSIRRKSDVPVLMLTARGDDVDRIVGLEMGADDYLQKPFNPRELIARIRAILRRVRVEPAEAATQQVPERISVGDVEIDKGARIATRGGQQLPLTTVEFDLLEALIRSAGQIISREELVKSILGRNFSPYDRSIDTHVSNLRKKLGHYMDGIERIKAIRSVGYVYAKPGDAAKE
jgi:DNA-binding response OmpR family regulator